VSSPTSEERQQAQEALAYIRETMESASSFTALSGWGLIAVGFIGIVAAWLAWSAGSAAQLDVWIPAAVLSIVVASLANAAKARRLAVPLWSGSLRKLAWVMAPTVAAGAMITYALGTAGIQHLLPGTWLALYGAGVTAGGTFSLRAVRWMGLVLLALGALAFVVPGSAVWFLALGFGALHLAFGLYVVRRHGG